ncbi:hypothetical protein KRX54_02900 [Actinomycetaceae bacterium TAE3-ERU4]|nr:hypothetical protein [Actinomycetaceae bacterium TAE3-ERU4]
MKKKLLPALALAILPFLGGCNIQAQMNIDTDLLVSGTVQTTLSGAEVGQAGTQGCTNFQNNFNHVQKENQLNPGARLTIVTQTAKTNGDILECTFSFNRWDPNANKKVLRATAYSYLLETGEPAKILKESAGSLKEFQLSLTFPLPVTQARGGKIDGRTVVFNSLKDFEDSRYVIAGDPRERSFWENWGNYVLLTGGLLLTLFVAYALWRARKTK